MASGPLTVQLRINADGSAAIVGLNRVRGALNDTGSAVSGLAASLKGLAMTAGAALSVGALASSFTSANRQAGLLRASLETVTGSVAKATTAWEVLQGFAAQTPYSLEQAVQGFINLKSMGLDPSIAALTSYGNTAGAMGKSLNQMIEAVADAATGEFERLKEFGIKAKIEKDQVVMTFQGATTSIANNAQAIEKYLLDIGNVQFAGGMERQAKTLEGSISNLGDAWDQFWVKLGDTGLTQGVIAVLNDVSSGIASLGEGMTEANDAASVFGETIATTYNELKTGVWSDTTTAIMATAGAIGGAIGLMTALSAAVGIATGVWGAFTAVLLANPVTLVIAGIGALIGVLYTLRDETITIGQTTTTVGATVSAVWETTASYSQAVWETFAAYVSGEFNRLPPAVSSAGSAILSVWSAVMTNLQSIASGAINYVANLFTWLGRSAGVLAGEVAVAFESGFSWDRLTAGLADQVQYTDRLGAASNQAAAEIAAMGREVEAKAGAIHAANIEEQLATVVTSAHADQQRQAALAAKLQSFEQDNLSGNLKRGAAAAKEGAAATGAGGKAHGGAAKAVKDHAEAMDALIKRVMPARDDTEQLAEATAILADKMAKGELSAAEYAASVGKLEDELLRSTQASQALIDEYDREGAQARKLAEDSDRLQAIIAKGGEQAERAKIAFENLGKQQAKNSQEADAWAEVWKNAVKRIDDTFANLWEDLFSGTKSTLDSLKKAITSWLAEVAHALLTKPLVVAITAGVTGTATAGAGGGTTQQGLDFFSKIGSYLTSDSIGKSFASGINNFAKLFGEVPAGLKVGLGNLSTVPNWAMGAGAIGGSLLGTAIFGNKGYSAIGSSIGSVAGTIIAGALATGPLAPFIVVAAGLLSGIAGGGLGSLFGAKEPRPGAYAAITHGGTGMLEDGVGAKGSFGLTFGMSDIGTSGLDANEMREVFEGFAKVSNVLADFYGKDVAAQVKASLEKASNEAWSKNGIMRYAMDVNQAFDVAFTDIINHAAATGDTLAVVMQAVVGDLNGTAENMAQQIEAGMQAAAALVGTATALEDTEIGALLNLTGTLTENALLLGAYANNMKESGETTAEAVARLVTNLTGLDAALILTSGHTNATGEDFIYLANMLAKAAEEAKLSMEGLIQIQNAYYEHFFTEEERALKQKEDSLKAIDKWNKEQGLEGIDTSAEFRAYIESLDLNTEAGRAAYVEAMKLVGAFITLDDALKTLGDTLPEVIDLFEAQRKTLRDLADQLDPTDPLSQKQRDEALDALRKAGYQGDLYDAKGLAAFLRALAELDDAGGDAGAELQKFIDTFTGVFDEVARIAEERADLELRLLELTGTEAELTAAKRRLELEAIDETNRAILERIYALEDARLAMDRTFATLERAINAERDAVNEEYQRRVDAINAERDAAQEAYDAKVEAINAEREAIAAAHEERIAAINAEREALQTQISAAQEALSKIEGILGSVQSALDGIRGQMAVSDIALAAARRQLASWASHGVLPDQEAFDRVMGTLNRDDKGNYASANAYRISQQATYANLLELERLGLAQKTAAERQLEALEAQTEALDAQITQADRIQQEQLEALDDQMEQAEQLHRERLDALEEQLKQAEEWRNDELERLDKILEDAKKALEITLGIYTEVMSIDDALKAFNQTMIDYLALRDQDKLQALDHNLGDAANDPMGSARVAQQDGFDSLRAEIIELRTVIASVGTAQITPLKSIDDRLRKFDTDGLPPGRDDVILLRAG